MEYTPELGTDNGCRGLLSPLRIVELLPCLWRRMSETVPRGRLRSAGLQDSGTKAWVLPSWCIGGLEKLAFRGGDASDPASWDLRFPAEACGHRASAPVSE